ncbi:hypothetical protein LINPERPRIM_LOCUS6381 [Linum perenne]
MLAYGCSADSVDEYCRMGETTSLECLRKFCNANINIYGSRYLCEPTVDDLCRLLDHSTRHGFLGMIGSLDSMHWEWKKFPTVWARQYTGHQKKPTIVLKAVGSYDTWIWNACFEMTGSNNDHYNRTVILSQAKSKFVAGQPVTKHEVCRRWRL